MCAIKSSWNDPLDSGHKVEESAREDQRVQNSATEYSAVFSVKSVFILQPLFKAIRDMGELIRPFWSGHCYTILLRFYRATSSSAPIKRRLVRTDEENQPLGFTGWTNGHCL